VKWVLPMAENGAGGDHTTAYLQLQGTPAHEIFLLTYTCLYEGIVYRSIGPHLCSEHINASAST
jgi:hypothetical protein